ncbi:MAG: putative membrane protein/protein-disulfide isomerase [Desulforhopalus sp.]|jgi:uncharacterized membrane protein/protein-disulfide isomerase
MSKHSPSSYRLYSVIVALLSLSGLAVSLYLSWSHYQSYTDITYSSFCAISQTINCDTVAQSQWSIFLGLPVAVWGVIGYLFFIIHLIPTYKYSQARFSNWSTLTLLGLVFSFISIYFGYISATKIHSYCILCIFSYATNFLLFFFAWIIHRRFANDTFLANIKISALYLKSSLPIKIIYSIFLTAVVITIVEIPHYWEYTPPPLNKNILTGITKEGHAWIGAESPKLTIEEYADYQCFQCYKIHYTLRQLITKYPDKIRLVHHHYPMDHEVNAVVVPEPFHVGSGKMAQLAIYAASKKKFWQTNDLLYELGRNKKTFDIKTIAEKTEIPVEELAWALESKKVKEILRYDIWHGMKLGITGTPSFVIQDKVYVGTIPIEILQENFK